jgi:hypothetical protein
MVLPKSSGRQEQVPVRGLNREPSAGVPTKPRPNQGLAYDALGTQQT